jgi:hypothetical protein
LQEALWYLDIGLRLFCLNLRRGNYREDSPDKANAEILIDKDGNGRIAKVVLVFMDYFQRFEDLSGGRGCGCGRLCPDPSRPEKNSSAFT